MDEMLAREEGNHEDMEALQMHIQVQRYDIIIEQFWGDDVLDSFNNESRDEDNILYQIYLKQISLKLYYDDF